MKCDDQAFTSPQPSHQSIKMHTFIECRISSFDRHAFRDPPCESMEINTLVKKGSSNTGLKCFIARGVNTNDRYICKEMQFRQCLYCCCHIKNHASLINYYFQKTKITHWIGAWKIISPHNLRDKHKSLPKVRHLMLPHSCLF